LQDDSPIEITYRDDNRENAQQPQRLEPSSSSRLTPLSTVTNMVRRMTTMKSPLTGTRFRTLRRQRQYETLDEGEESTPGPVDISSLEGLGYELRTMSPVESSKLDEEETEYVSPTANRQDKPDFRAFVNKRRSVADGIGEGMNQVGAQLRRNATKAPTRGPSARDDTAKAIDRKKTVRNLGQKLASEKGTIVVVNEEAAVDLSQFEGPTISFRSSTASLRDVASGRSSTFGSLPSTDDSKSYFFPSDPDVPNWKPFPMKTWWIILLIVLAIAIAVVQEGLCQISQHKSDEHPGIIAFNNVKEVPTIQFFAWKYLPTMIAVTYSVLFNLMDFEIRRLEPYYQLSQETGATAATSLNCDHLTMFQYFVPFKAFRLKQWAVLLSTTGNIIASMIGPAVQNPTLLFVENEDPSCNPESDDPLEGPCGNGQPQMWVNVQPVWSRILTACYLIIAIIGVVLVFQLRRKSGLLSDPKGIAGIASMATKSHILRDFKGTDEATIGQLHKKLQHRRYLLYKSSIWQGEYVPENDSHSEHETKIKNPHPPMLRPGVALPFMGFMVFGLVGIPLISLTKARALPNAAPWLPILLATLLKLLFNTFEADVRLMEPYYQLSRGNAKPEHSLTLDYQASIYGIMPFQALINRHWLVMLVGISSVALDVFTVTVGSFSVNSYLFLSGNDSTSNQDETFVSFVTSLVLSMTILLFVLVTTALVWWRRRHPFLPREPSTIAANLAFIYSSNMLTDFIDTERLDSRAMERKLKKMGKTYALGWFRGRDGEVHCAIDEEPLLSRYVHGKSYVRALAGPGFGAGEPEWEFVGQERDV
jgi:hypothetical protein